MRSIAFDVLIPPFAFALLALALSTLSASSRSAYLNAPLPPPRPIELGVRPKAVLPAPKPDTAKPADNKPAESKPVENIPSDSVAPAQDDCAKLLASTMIDAVRRPAIVGPGTCGIANPVSVKAFILANGRRIPLVPEALMRCDFAGALATWVRDDLAPLVEARATPLEAIADAAAFDCRGRNRVAGAKMSEHGLGNAIDVRAFTLKGKSIELTNTGDRVLTEALKASVCRRFKTVLGPGSDGYHEAHVHLDLEQRRNGNVLCQWDVK